MSKSILTRTGDLVKHLTGIRDLSDFRKDLKKRWGRIVYRRKYTASELVGLMQEMGMKAGSVVCIHSAMKEFYNYQGSAQELIECIMETLTPEGTLLMPAYVARKERRKPGFIFDVVNTPTAAGYLAETFRQMPGVKRSISARHSACAWGKLADYLLQDHHKGKNCWDESSPWYRLCEQDGLVFTLGLPRSFMGTFIHCVEGLLSREHLYWAQFFNSVDTWTYRDTDGQLKTYTNDESYIERRTKKRRITRRFGRDIYKISRLSNLEVKMFRAKPCLDMMLDLGRKGISVYYVPKAKVES